MRFPHAHHLRPLFQTVCRLTPRAPRWLRTAPPNGHCAEIATTLLRDDEDAIAAALEELSRQGAALVLTVGGTGLGPRDRTPEAT